MKINRYEDKKVYNCFCGHTCTIYHDGTIEGEPFKEHDKDLVVYEPAVEETKAGTRRIAKPVTHKGYICPKCGKLQIEV